MRRAVKMVWARFLIFIVLDRRSSALWLVAEFAEKEFLKAYIKCLYVLLIRSGSSVEKGTLLALDAGAVWAVQVARIVKGHCSASVN